MIDLEHYRLQQDGLPADKQVAKVLRPQKPPRRRQALFLKGPIPLVWLQQASAVGGAALATGIVLWFLAGLTGQLTNRLSYRRLSEFRIGRHAGYRALRRLERAKLLTVQRHPGRCPLVTLIKELPEL